MADEVDSRTVGISSGAIGSAESNEVMHQHHHVGLHALGANNGRRRRHFTCRQHILQLYAVILLQLILSGRSAAFLTPTIRYQKRNIRCAQWKDDSIIQLEREREIPSSRAIERTLPRLSVNGGSEENICSVGYHNKCNVFFTQGCVWPSADFGWPFF